MIVERQKLFENTLHEEDDDDAPTAATAKVELQQNSNNMDGKLDTGKSSCKEETLVKHKQQQASALQYHQQQEQQHLLQLQQCEQPQQQQQQKQSNVKHQIPAAAAFSATSIDKSSAACKPKCFSTAADVVNIDSDSAGDAYDADVDDVVDEGIKIRGKAVAQDMQVKEKQTEREHIYELFQPWALKTYGDQAKTKTITLRKKARILKALEGKEHSRPDSSKFRFWVKSKAFTTKRPEGFAEVPGSQRKSKQFPPDAVLSDNPSEVDLFVGSTNKNFGQRTYRKVAVVEEFFDIIYNVHMELGGRSGMHAGQKRTYRIITETYGFLPREAVTRFLSTCPECKKNLRPSSPSTSSGGGQNEEPNNESSSEVDALNYSSHTESSIEGGTITAKHTTLTTTTTTTTGATVSKAKKRRFSSNQTVSTQQQQQQQQQNQDHSTKPQQLKSEVTVVEPFGAPAEPMTSAMRYLTKSPSTLPGPSFFPTSTSSSTSSFNPSDAVALDRTDKKLTASLPKIRINPHFQRRRPSSPGLVSHHAEPVVPSTTSGTQFNPLCLDFASLKTQDSLFRYYEFMRRFYGGSAIGFGGSFTAQSSSVAITAPQPAPPVLAPPIYGSSLLQSLRFPTGTAVQNLAITTPSLRALGESKPVAANIIEMSDDDEDDDAGALVIEDADILAVPPLPKKIKLSQESSPDLKTQAKSVSSLSVLKAAKQQEQQQQQSSAINLSKAFHFSSNGRTTANTATSATSSSTATTATSVIKVECSSAASAPTNSNTCRTAHGDVATLRIPQVSRPSSLLPPLDLERLKPITSTYLQLTRSMGLSDEDALRFDNLLTAARTIRHHEVIIKSNGDKIVRNWTTHEGDETELNNNDNNFPPNIFEDGKDGADEHITMTTNFGLPTHVFGKPGYSGIKKKFEVPQRKLPIGMEDGQFEEAWDLEPDFKTNIDMEAEPEPVPEIEPEPQLEMEPREVKHNWKNLLDLAKQPNSSWKPIESNTHVRNKYIGQGNIDPWHLQPEQTNIFGHDFVNNGVESWPVTQQEPAEQQTPLNLNGVHMTTHTYSSKPTQFIRTDSFSGPQTIFTGTWPNVFGGWTTMNENPQQPSWQDVSTKSNADGDEKTVQKPGNTSKTKPTVAVQPAKYPNKSLEELLNELYGVVATTPATTTTTVAASTTTKPQHKPITTINIKDLPIADILNNGQPIDENFLKTLPEHLRPFEDTVIDIRDSYNIENIPMTPESDIGTYMPLPPRTSQPTPRISPPPPASPSTITPQATSHQSNIATFLNKVGLSIDDILFKTAARTVTKTIVDENGDILTATFMLSSVKDRDADQNKEKIKLEVKPLK